MSARSIKPFPTYVGKKFSHIVCSLCIGGSKVAMFAVERNAFIYLITVAIDRCIIKRLIVGTDDKAVVWIINVVISFKETFFGHRSFVRQ